MQLEFAKVRPVTTPSYGTPGSAGIDFFVPDDFGQVELMAGQNLRIPSGIIVKGLTGYTLIGFNRSSVASLGLLVGAQVIDADYQGEICLHVTNVSDHVITISSGQKLVQFIVVPYLHCLLKEQAASDLFTTTSVRGAAGFGSTGN